MNSIRNFAVSQPLLFVIALTIFQPLLAVPCVAIIKLTGASMTPLQVIVPTVQSVVVLWLIWVLGWWKVSGLTGRVRNTHLLIYPALALFVPALAFGTIEISAGWVLFYFMAMLMTGISEEGFSRGIAVPVLLKYGKWAAVLIAAVLFSVGHLTNAIFEQFSALDWLEKFSSTFGFAVLYGALFLRTGNLMPLIFLHAVVDYIFVTSGTAGPFKVEGLDFLPTHLAISYANLAVGLYLMRGVTEEDLPRIGQPAST